MANSHISDKSKGYMLIIPQHIVS